MVGAYTRWIIRHAWWVSLFGAILGITGGYYSVQLYKNLRPDLEELLPTTARSVIDLGEVSSRLKSIDSLGLLIFSGHPEKSRRFVDDLVVELKKIPPEVSAGIDHRINRELEFFAKRKALYLELNDLLSIRDYIRDRIEYEKSLYNPMNIFSEEEIPEPKFDMAALEKKYQAKASVYSNFPDGYYATPDGKKRLIQINAPSQKIEVAHALKDAIVQAVAKVDPKKYSPDIELHYTGNVQDLIEEQAALLEDLELSTVIVALLVILVLWFYYRSFRASMALMGSLLIGTLWTFGVSYFAVGYLNANSAFLGSIVMGNGINFGIIFLARYMEERRLGHRHYRALKVAMKNTTTATMVAALAAGLAYGSLILTGFRGFKQFGIIGLIGMVLCWISSFTLLPAYLSILDRWKTLVKDSKKMHRAWIASAVARFVYRFPKPIWWATLALTLASLLILSTAGSHLIETDLRKLRDQRSMTTGSGFYTKDMDEIMQSYGSPTVLLPRNKSDVDKLVDALKKEQAREGSSSLIAKINSLDDFIPAHQNEKIKTLDEIEGFLGPKIMSRLGAKEKAMIRDFLTPEAYTPVGEKNLPPMVLDKFTEKNGTLGSMILVEPPLTGETREGVHLIHFVKQLRDIADRVAPGTPVAGRLPVSADMLEAITRDGPRATLFAFLAVVVLVILLFLHVQTILLALFALLIGIVWMGAGLMVIDLKINFLNFIALPITFGIGVDYGVNIFQRYRSEGPGQITRVIASTGGAVGLASMTTMIGYGSLLIAGNRAFVSFGALAVLGEITCLVAAIISLPAYLHLKDRKDAST